MLQAHLPLERPVAPELAEQAERALVKVVPHDCGLAIAQADARLARAHAELHVLRTQKTVWQMTRWRPVSLGAGEQEGCCSGLCQATVHAHIPDSACEPTWQHS